MSTRAELSRRFLLTYLYHSGIYPNGREYFIFFPYLIVVWILMVPLKANSVSVFFSNQTKFFNNSIT